jgi:branched-chain amino acid transport system substrate-binding protein
MPTETIGRRAMLGAAGALGAAVLPRRARAQAPIRIGVLTDENGPYAASGGAGSVAAARMAAADFGVSGVEILHADTQNKPDVAGSLARQWYESGVDAIVDLPVTPVAAAVQQVAREKGRTVMITAAAVTEFTSKTCAPISSHWADDTHALAAGVGRLQRGGAWFFITVDFSFGRALQAAATQVIEAAGGHVVGTATFPIGNTDFSAQIVEAQSAAAQVIGLASVGGDQVNLIKGAAEFGLSRDHKLAAFLVYLTDIQALGLDTAQGLSFPTSFYWDENPATRAFGRRFLAERGAMPTQNQANVYAATLHFLKATQAAGSRDPLAVNKAMRAAPVAFFDIPTTLRADGRILHDVGLYRVKAPAASKGAWDYLEKVGSVPAAEAFLPASAVCVA